MRSFSTNIVKILLITVILTLFSPIQAFASDGSLTKVLYVLTSEFGDFKNDRLTLSGVPAVLHFSERKDNESGFQELSEFSANLNEYISQQDGKPQTAALSLYNSEGAVNVIIQFGRPTYDNGTLSFKTKVLQGNLPAELNTSTLFVVMLEPNTGSQEG